MAWLVLSATATLHAAEWFVGHAGDDGRDGRSPASAWASIQKGVDALQPGDTLTILPGEYAQGVTRAGLGSDAADTVIRAQIPGTVLLRGDVPAPAFAPVEGKRLVFAADFDAKRFGTPQAVVEHETRTLLRFTPDPSELEYLPGRFCFDPQAGRLFISTSDMEPAVGRGYTVSVLPVSGLYLSKPRRVRIDGIGATGFFRLGASREAPLVWGVPWGIALDEAVDCTIRRCTAYLNAGGIVIDRSTATLVEDCVAFGNGSRYEVLSGNIMSFGGLNRESSSGNLIRRCLAFDGNNGIHQYGVMTGHVVIRDNITWNNLGGNIHIKTGRSEDNQKFGLVERNVAIGDSAGGVVYRHNLVVAAAQHPAQGKSDIRSEEHPDLDLSREMADPDNLDFRLQADSRFRGGSEDGADQGPHPYRANVFYVSPQGDDAAAGLSMRSAWRTLERATRDLRPGDTLYLDGGTYASSLTFDAPGAAGEPVHIRGRGRSPVVIEGGIQVQNASGLRLERLTLHAPVALRQGRDIALHNCVLPGGIDAQQVSGLAITHCVAAAPIRLQASAAVHLSGNLFKSAKSPAVVVDDPAAIAYSDYNGYTSGSVGWQVQGQARAIGDLAAIGERYAAVVTAGESDSVMPGRGPLGSTLGLYHPRNLQPRKLRVLGPFVHSVTDTTANLEWWTTAPTGLTVSWGEGQQFTQKQGVEAHRFGTYSLTGLKPGTAYSFKLLADELPDHQAVVRFTTRPARAAGKVYHVAPGGDDSRTGLSPEQAFRTLDRAAREVVAGDTVIVAGGRYSESVRIRATGAPDQPITFRAAPGQKVVLAGQQRSLNSAFHAANQHHLRFDGFHFEQFDYHDAFHLSWSDRSPGNATSGVFNLYRSDDVQITRCFNDGRGGGYAPGLVQAVQCKDLAVRNSVNIGTMGGIVTFFGCPGLRLEHCVSLGNFIYVAVGVNAPDQAVTFARNILTDSSLGTKASAPLFELGTVESLRESDNCYLLRTPDEQKMMFFFYHQAAYSRASAAYGLSTQLDQPLRMTELTRLSLAQYQAQFAPQSGSIIADPQFAAAQGLKVDASRGPIAVVEALMALDTLDFKGLMALNPQVQQKGMGLEPAAFAD
jgi:parallel beta-helix repeat protein